MTSVEIETVEGFSDEAYEHWREHGYVIVKLLGDDEVRAALDNIYEYMPSWEEYKKAPRKYPAAAHGTPGGIGGISQHFPFAGSGLNAISAHPAFRAVAERILGTPRLLLTESQVIGKYPGAHDFEQLLHLDYPNVTLAFPPRDADRIDDLTTITYYTDVTLAHGPTYVVPHEFTHDYPRVPARRSRADAPELYEREIPATLPAGSTLIYSVNTWHRGSAMQPAAGARFSHHIGFRRAPSRWCGQSNFQWNGGTPEMDAFLQSASPAGRELAGFPPVGDPYWDPQTLADVAARYPAMDIEPYRS